MLSKTFIDRVDDVWVNSSQMPGGISKDIHINPQVEASQGQLVPASLSGDYNVQLTTSSHFIGSLIMWVQKWA